MTKYDIEEFLVQSGESPMVAGRIRSLIEQAGGVEQFGEMTDNEITKLYNDAHPGSTKGLGRHTYDAIDLVRKHVKGHSEAAIVAKKASEDAAARKNAEVSELKDQMQRGFDSEPLEVELLQEIVMSDLLKTMKTITIGQLKFLMGMKRGGAR